jgi:hypothetical protein
MPLCRRPPFLFILTLGFTEHNNALWYRNIGASTPGDDALSVLSTTAKPYRKLIDSNSITVFDFRIYLFARQASMLFRLGRVVEVARRGAYFVSTFARTLREHQVRSTSPFWVSRRSPSSLQASLGTNFVESWTYSACLSIVDECERRISEDLNAGETSFIAVKAELLELAKKQVRSLPPSICHGPPSYAAPSQLDKIGMSAGHLPTTHPFSMSLNESSSPGNSPNGVPPTRSLVTRRDLLDAVSNLETFDRLYIDLSRRTIQAYQSSGRRRSAVKLHSFLAALEQCALSMLILPNNADLPPPLSCPSSVTAQASKLLRSSTRNFPPTTPTRDGRGLSLTCSVRACSFKLASTCLEIASSLLSLSFEPAWLPTVKDGHWTPLSTKVYLPRARKLEAQIWLRG